MNWTGLLRRKATSGFLWKPKRKIAGGTSSCCCCCCCRDLDSWTNIADDAIRHQNCADVGWIDLRTRIYSYIDGREGQNFCPAGDNLRVRMILLAYTYVACLIHSKLGLWYTRVQISGESACQRMWRCGLIRSTAWTVCAVFRPFCKFVVIPPREFVSSLVG